MSKHTPGPWIHGRNDAFYRNGNRLIWTSKGPGFGTIAEASDYDRDRSAANARLIAAAPDLLAALKKAAKELGINDPNDHAFESDLAGEIRAAIAKAEEA